LFSLYAPLALLAVNIQEMVITDGWRALGISLAISALLFGVIYLLVRNPHAAGAAATLIIVLLMSYGHVYDLAKNYQVGNFLIGRHRYLMLVWAVMLALGLWAVLWRFRVGGELTGLLNIAGAVLMVLPLLVLGRYYLGTKRAEAGVERLMNSVDPAGLARAPADAPDIYYLILDSYPRADMLQQWWGHDNSKFVRALESRGFIVADEANANYVGTAVSLGSSLNLQYLQDLGLDLTQGIYPGNLKPAIVNSRVRHYLESLGYSVVTFPTGYDFTEMRDSDYYLEPGLTEAEQLRLKRSINEFEALAARATILRPLLDLDAGRALASSAVVADKLDEPRAYHRELVLSTFSKLQNVPGIPGPKFVFAHIGSPHQPYVFQADGSEIPEEVIANRPGNPISDHNAFFTDQVTYVSKMTLETLDAILASSETPPIILLQADHGPELGFDWYHPDAPRLEARLAILSAYYVPSECRDDIYPSITPVNSFRVVFDCEFGEDFGLLEDRSYYSVLRGPASGRLKFVPVENLLKETAQ